MMRKKRKAESAKANNEGAKKNLRWSNLSYTTRVTASFALVAAMTAMVSFGVLSFVWEQHFQSYTRENMQRLADTAAMNIGERYSDVQVWDGGVLQPAKNVSELSRGVGVQVTDARGNILYDDSSPDEGSGKRQLSLAPTARQSMAAAPIKVDGTEIGTVRVWAYGSDALLTQTDQEFRNQSYRAMVAAAVAAVCLALAIGFLFARNLVRPINSISQTAERFGDGQMDARTHMEGDDEIARLGETFDEMADSIERDRKLERRLTTDVAHELRTPLMAIQSTVEAMVDGVFEADEERLVTVNSEVQRLSRLVDALLKLSRLENRTVPLEEQVVNVSELISGLVATHEAFVEDSGLILRFEPEDDVYVYGNPDMLRQATANLISNAVRYTPSPGTVTVSVHKGDIMASIAVSDTGIGLTPQEAKMVFSRFWRADAGRNREQGGLGIGLAVVKEIVDQHGGWVRVEGKPDEGATFTIYIPLFSEERVKSREKARARQLKLSHNGTLDEQDGGTASDAK